MTRAAGLSWKESTARQRRIVLVYQRGYNTTEVARAFGLSRNYVWRVVHWAGVHRKGDHRKVRV